MNAPSERLVPKVHPATRPVEPGDPYSLHATAVTGDPELMLECLVHEYAGMGWNTDQVMALFGDPFYPALHALLRHHGADQIRSAVAAAMARRGIFRVSGTVRDEPDPDDEPELIELGTRRVLEPKGDSHAQGL
jgi:hypothetical protein